MYTISVPRTENWKTFSGQRQLSVEGGDWSHMEDLIHVNLEKGLTIHYKVTVISNVIIYIRARRARVVQLTVSIESIHVNLEKGVAIHYAVIVISNVYIYISGPEGPTSNNLLCLYMVIWKRVLQFSIW